MIIIGIGANLNHPDFSSPRHTCGAALDHLARSGDIRIDATSRWYRSAPVLSAGGAQGEQPWYVNGAIAVETELSPVGLLDAMMSVEGRFGRVRSLANSPRTLDLDLVAYHGEHIETDHLTVPHPRLAERAFVVLPLADLDPNWKHPVTGTSILTLKDGLPADQAIEPMPQATGLFGTEWVRAREIDM